MDPDSDPSRPDAGLPWEELRALAGQRARALLGVLQPDDLEDIVQLAMVRYVRASRAAPVTNPHGLATTAADRAARDWLRARRRWRARFRELDDADDVPAGDAGVPPEAFGDPLERVRFTVLEFFRQSAGPCAELAGSFFESRDWASVATATGLAPAAVRKRWWRCVERLRRELRGTLEVLFASLNGDDA